MLLYNDLQLNFNKVKEKPRAAGADKSGLWPMKVFS